MQNKIHSVPKWDTSTWVKGKHKTLGQVQTIFANDASDGKSKTGHVLMLRGETKEFDRLWKPKPLLRWVTCQSTVLSDRGPREIVTGIEIEGERLNLIALFNPYAKAAQQALQEWVQKGSATLMVVMEASREILFVDFDAPSVTRDALELPLTMASADCVSHKRCMQSILNCAPKYIDGVPAVYVTVEYEELLTLLASVGQ